MNKHLVRQLWENSGTSLSWTTSTIIAQRAMWDEQGLRARDPPVTTNQDPLFT